MKTVLLCLCLLGSLRTLAQSAHHPHLRYPDARLAEPERSAFWRDSAAASAIRTDICRVDGLVQEHFRAYVEDQLRGRADHLGTPYKYLRLDEHRRFLKDMADLKTDLVTDMEGFKNTRLPSLRLVFQAYLNSLGIYHKQSLNLVSWKDSLLADGSGKYLRPQHRAGRQWFVPIREGNIDDYNQAYQFMELCKNNLLKEFSIWEVSQTADTLARQVAQLQRANADLRGEVARQRDSLAISLTLLRQTNVLLLNLEKRAVLAQYLQVSLKNARVKRRNVVVRLSKRALHFPE